MRLQHVSGVILSLPLKQLDDFLLGSMAFGWVKHIIPPFSPQRLEVPAPVTHRPANLQVGQISGQSDSVCNSPCSATQFARKKKEKESQEGEEERQNQEEQESILAIESSATHVVVTVISAFLAAVASVQNGRLPKKSGGIVQKTSKDII